MIRIGSVVFAVFAVGLHGCGGPPDLDEETTDAGSSSDGQLPDAAGPSCEPFVPEGDAVTRNPYGIQLTDITFDMPEQYYSGRTVPDPLAFGAGVAVGDLDGDGDLDLVLARNDDPDSPDLTGRTTLLWNMGVSASIPQFEQDSEFSDHFAGVRSVGVALADYDADGDLDVFVANHGHDSLLRNDGGGQFTDVTETLGVAGRDDDASMGAVWADVNLDGLLDLYVHSFLTDEEIAPSPRNANRLYVQLGDGTFVDQTVAAQAGGDGASHAVLAADLDGDGEIEIYVANDTFAVNGRGGFTGIDPDVALDPISFDDAAMPVYLNRASQWGVDNPSASMGLSLADLDGDGDDDLYVADYGLNRVQLWDAAYERYATDAQTMGLAASTPPGLEGPTLISWGTRFVDLDRDGALEAIIVNGDVLFAPPGVGWCQNDRFYRRLMVGYPFADVSEDVGLRGLNDACVEEGPRSGRGVALGDLDGDGDDDYVVAPYAEAFRFYRNDTPQCGRSYVRVRLRGTVSSVDAIGAVFALRRSDGSSDRRTLYGGGAPYSQSDRALEIGLDGARGFASATIEWPSGLVQRVDDQLVIDGQVTITEPRWLSVDRRVAYFGGDVPVVTYQPVDESGDPLGPAGAGRDVQFVRSDGPHVEVTDHGDGRYTATLAHPAEIRTTVVRVIDGGQVLRPRLTIAYRGPKSGAR